MPEKPHGIFEQVNYFNDFTILVYVNKENADYSPHWHPAIEIIMPIDNTYDVVIDDIPYHLNEKDIILIPPGVLHALHAPDTGKRLILLIDHSLISDLKGMSSILPVIRVPRVIRSDSEEDRDVHKLAREMLLSIEAEYSGATPLWEVAIYAKIIQLFLLIGRKYFNSNVALSDTKQYKQREYIEKFDLIFDYIHNNYMKEISLDNIAEIANFSKFHFSRLFKQFTNMSFYEYLNNERIQVAETLLLDRKLSITEVAFQSGFSSISTFNRVFKSVKKCTPTEFRNLYQIK